MATKKAAANSTSAPAEATTGNTSAEKQPTSTPIKAPVAKMTRTQIVKAMAEKLATEPKQIQAFFDALLEMATEQTREAGEFTIPGFGKLVKAERKERMGRNPQTGEEIKIAAKTTVKFRVAKAATDAIVPPEA